MQRRAHLGLRNLGKTLRRMWLLSKAYLFCIEWSLVKDGSSVHNRGQAGYSGCPVFQGRSDEHTIFLLYGLWKPPHFLLKKGRICCCLEPPLTVMCGISAEGLQGPGGLHHSIDNCVRGWLASVCWLESDNSGFMGLAILGQYYPEIDWASFPPAQLWAIP